MNHALASIVLGACLLALGACDKKPPPTPVVQEAVSTESAATTATGSVVYPPISSPSVDPSASAARPDPGQQPSDGTRKPAQGAAGTPKPGQNNDHSAPLGPSGPASAPR